MASSIFSKMERPASPVSPALAVMRSKSPADLGRSLMETNPEFRSFVESLRGQDPFARAREMGVDLSKFRD